MEDQPRRPRRLISKRSLAALRVAGYRYSYTREAWVHHVGGGRFGPVFTELDNIDVSELPEELRGRLDEQLREPSLIRMAPNEERQVLPSRPGRRPGDRLVPVRWQNGEETTTVFVDGRPPLRDGEFFRKPLALAPAPVIDLREIDDEVAEVVPMRRDQFAAG